MPDVRLTRDEEAGRLPAACMCCGEPATDWVKRNFPLRPPVVHGPSGFLEIYALRMLIASANVPRVTLPTSFCPRHRHYWRLRTALLFGGLAGMFVVLGGGLLLVLVLLIAARIDAPWLSLLVIVPLLAYLTAWTITVTRVMRRSIAARLAEDGSNRVVLSHVDAQYIAALERQRSLAQPIAQSAGTPLPEVVPTALRAGAPAPPMALPAVRPLGEGPAVRGPRQRGAPNQTGLLIALLVGVSLILLILLAGVVMIGLALSRSGRQGAEQRQEARANQPPEDKREVERDVEPGTVVPNVPATAPLPADLKGQPGTDLIPLLEPRKDVVHGHWLVKDGVLHCNDGSFVPRVQFPYLPPAEYYFVVTFTQPGLRNGISLVMPNPNGGSFFWFLGNEAGAGYGLHGNPDRGGRSPGLIKANTVHTTKVEVRKRGVRAFVDGKELLHLDTDYRDLTSDDWRRIHDTRFPAVACDDPTVFYHVRIIGVTGQGKKAR